MYEMGRADGYWQGQLMYWGPKVVIALLILLATWIAARAVKWAMKKLVDKIPALRKHTTGKPGDTVGSQLGTIGKLIIWLVGIMAALQYLGVGQILDPINRLVTDIFSYLDNVLGAALIFFIGFILARVFSQLVETSLTAANVDALLARIGIGSTDGTVRADPSEVPPGTTPGATRNTLARAGGILAFAVVIIPAAIAALEVLAIETISVPAINMLNDILAAIPRVLSAGLWLGVAYIVARFLKSIIEGILPPTGFDRAVHSTGVIPATSNPSRIVATIAFLAVMLGAAIEAAKQLGGGTVAIFLAQITELGGKVIFGTLIIVTGIFLARIISGLVGSSTADDSYAKTMVRYAIIALFTAIGLTFMGLADQIVILAFGLILGSAAVAVALAFGLGGRDAAARLLERYADGDGSPPGTRTPRPPRIERGEAPETEPEDRQPPLV